MGKTKKQGEPIRVRDDLARGGYKGKIYQRPAKGINLRWPGRAYVIEDLKVSEGDTVLSIDYVDARIRFVDRDKIERDLISLVQILDDIRVTKGMRCYDTFEDLKVRSRTTI
jgi:hypothetical protein